MRRKDREVTDVVSIVSMIQECQIIRIGLADGDFPYIVPLNFGYAVQGEQITFYVHGAMAGRKYELMKRNKVCSFELDTPLKLESIYEQKSVTMRYRCVMGTAAIEFLEGQEKQHAMDAYIMNRYEETRAFEYDRRVLEHTAVAKLTVLELTAKVNPVSDERSK